MRLFLIFLIFSLGIQLFQFSDQILRRTKGIYWLRPFEIKLEDDGNLSRYEFIVLDAMMGFSAEDYKTLQRKVNVVDSIVRDITSNTVIVEPGVEWAYNFHTRTIYYPADKLLSEEFKYSVAKVFHELGHWIMSKIVDDKFFFSSETKRLLLNGVDDPRVNNGQIERYKGLKENYIDPLYKELVFIKEKQGEYVYDPLEVLPHEQYILGLIYRWAMGRDNPAIKDEDVLQAINQSWADYKKIIEIYPKGKEPSEDEILEMNKIVQRKVREKLWPIYEKLIKKSMQMIEQGLKEGKLQPVSDSLKGKPIPDDLLSDEAKKIIERKSKELAEELESKITREDLEEAKRALERAEREGKIIDPIEGLPPDAWEEKVPMTEELPSGTTLQELKRVLQKIQPMYQEQVDKLTQLINEAVQYLRNIFQLNAFPEYEYGYQSGRPDIRQWWQRKLTGRVDYFKRRTLPLEREYAVSLVIDESGSMDSPEKKSNALQALVLFMETLTSLGIDYNLIGFGGGDPIIREDFGVHPNMFDRERIVREFAENIGSGGVTNDVGAVKKAIEEVKKIGREKKLIIVISDGEGNVDGGLISHRYILEQADQEGVKIVGIGIGEDMREYVDKTYIYKVIVKDIKDLPRTLYEILTEELK
jgi:uncharacterized protein with von Willebrand factor type A (vWA) domain